MTGNKFITILLSVAAIVFSGIVNAQTNEQQHRLSDEPSLFERYTNSAQDLILKVLELVGINYRRGGTDPENGLNCSGFFQIVFTDAVGMLLPRTCLLYPSRCV